MSEELKGDINTEMLSCSDPVYLIVADETEEFDSSLLYAARAAERHNAKVAVLCIVQDEDHVFLPWGGVQDHIDQERRAEAESFLGRVAERLNEYGLMPSYYICEGNPTDIVREVVNNDPNITKLILGGSTGTATPGPLVAYFCGKGLSELRVPVTVVPGHLTPEAIDHFAETP